MAFKKLIKSVPNPQSEQVALLFDRDYYLAHNPDIAETDVDPLQHFIGQGIKEGRDPSAIFKNSHYAGEEDLGSPPVRHFLETGGRSGRNPHPLFDTQYYLNQYPDIAASEMNPFLHYLSAPAKEGRNPNPLFDSKWYLQNHPELETNASGPATGFDVLTHYLTQGDKAGDQPHPLFSPTYYIAQIDGHEAEGFNSLIHYFLSGPTSDANPHPLLDQAWYRERAPEIISTGQTQLAHYITSGAADGFNPCAQFHTWWYAERYLGGDAAGINPLTHFMTIGEKHNANPNPYFMTRWYREHYMIAEQNQHHNEQNSEENALLHYHTNCEIIRREMIKNVPVTILANPNPWMDTAWYFAENPDVLHSGQTPLYHYIEAGADEYRNPGPHFDAFWYKETHDTFGMSALAHFLELGAIEGNAPNSLWQQVRDAAHEGVDVEISRDGNNNPLIDPRQYKIISDSDLFDRNFYTENYLAPENIKIDPVEHYLVYGAHLGYNPGPNFNTIAYRKVNHDLRSAKINPLLHYIQHGRLEGRQASREHRDNQVTNFRFSQPEYGPITDVLEFDSEVLPPENLNESLCIHLHFYHTDMAEEFCEILNRLTLPFTLLVSIQIDESEEEWHQYFTDYITHASTIVVKACANRGRDVSPWLITFRKQIEEHDIFCHLHTKKSGYNKFQQSWRRYLTHTTFGTKTIVNQILDIFANNPQVGLVSPAYFYILRNQPNYGKNYEQYERLYMALFGDIPEETCPDYPAGSFFWARTKMLAPLFDLDMQLEDFDEEEGQVDGTIAHALERILGALPTLGDYEKRCIAIDIPFDLTRYIHPARVEKLNHELLLLPSFQIAADDRPRFEAVEKRKIAVYSAITGGYESYVRPLVIDPNIEYFLFTDTPEKFDPDWATVIETPYHGHTPVRTARYIKTHPHFFFPDYDYAIWMDANVLPTASIHPLINKLEGTAHHAAFIPHPLRFNCMEEGMELIKFKLDDKKIIEQQLTRYGKIEGVFQEELIETNFFICRPQLESTRKFMSYWWSELNNYSHRDQLSIGYALLMSGIDWTPLFEDNISIRDHENFFLLEHEMHNRAEFISRLTQAIDNEEGWTQS